MNRRLICVSLIFFLVVFCPVGLGDEQSDESELAALQKSVDMACSQGQYAQGVIDGQKAVALATKLYGPDDVRTAYNLNNLGVCYECVQQYDQAEAVGLRAIQIREAKLGKDHPHVALSLNNLSRVYILTGQPDKAEPMLQRVLAIRQATLGKDDLQVAACLVDLAGVYGGKEEYAKAEPMYQQALQIQESKLGPNHQKVAATLGQLARLYQSMGQYAKAEPMLQRALEITGATLGKDHPENCNILIGLAKSYIKLDQQDKAEQVLLQAVTIAEAKLPKDHITIAVCMVSLARLYTDMAQYAKVEPLCLRAIAIEEAQGNRDSQLLFQTLLELANSYRLSCQYAKAEPLYQRDLQLAETRYGKDAILTASALGNLACLYIWMGQLNKADPLLQRSLEIQEAKLGNNSYAVGVTLANQAEMYKQMGNLAKASELYRRSLEITEPIDGKDSLSVGIRLNGLGELYVDMGQLDKAEQMFTQSLEIREARLGKDHPRVAYALNSLASVYSRRGEYAKAEPLYQRSLAIAEARLGKEHFYVANALTELAALKAATGDYTESAALCDRLIDSKRAHISHVLPSLPETEQIAFLRGFQDALYQSFSLAILAKEDKDLVALSAQWAISGKGILIDVLSERARLARASQDPQVKSKADELAAIRSKLSKLIMNPPGSDDYIGYRKQLVDLQTREKELSKALGQLVGQTGWSDTRVDLAMVRAALPQDAVLIDVVKFPVCKFKTLQGKPEGQSTHYAAWIIPSAKQGEVTLLDLGDADLIDQAVECLYSMLSSPAPTNDERAGLLAGEAVTRVWVPIQKAVGNARNLIISPDGALWMMPWGALPDGNDKFLVETRCISYTVSGRDLIAGRDTVASHGAAIFADPDYDLSPSEAFAQTNRILGGSAAAKTTVRTQTNNSSRFPATRCKRVPDSAVAAKAIVPKLKDYVHAEPAVYLGNQALEGVAKSLKSPAVLVLITHGFALDNQNLFAGSMPTTPRGPSEAEVSRGLAARAMYETPLLRCGLVLAGANNHQQVVQGDDGLLTGIEIVGTDLRGTELVVMGACDTAVGQMRNGEGVASLRQAFQLAGAKAVVSTLWRVPVKETDQLLPMFFDNLAHGQGKAEALRNAQVAMIDQLRKERGDAPPWCWAAFTITGEWK
jgi:tetratricopeptide (TPR) repeat protein